LIRSRSGRECAKGNDTGCPAVPLLPLRPFLWENRFLTTWHTVTTSYGYNTV